MPVAARPTALVFYHYFHPDDVVSAQHYADLCTGLQKRGWDVTVMPSNRGCREDRSCYQGRDEWCQVHIQRIWRPAFREASMVGRLLNSAWMIAAWSSAVVKHRPELLVVGTDPVFSVLTAIPWRLFRPRTRIFHWCFDMHPEAAIAEGMLRAQHPVVRLLQGALRKAYGCCDLIGSIGSCMTRRLRTYTATVPMGLYTPWALEEPEAPLEVDGPERSALFGEAKLALMYSGSYGRAHDGDLVIALARRLRSHPEIQFAFSVRGNRVEELRRAVQAEDSNISFVDFAPQERLQQRLSAADIQIVSLRQGYEGTVVPSKFQGALAAGRPVLFTGSTDSAVSGWIKEYRIGWDLGPDNLEGIAQSLIRMAEDPRAGRELNRHCHAVYHQQFSREAVLDRLHEDLEHLVRTGAPRQPSAGSSA